jgi:hypothetical protein
MATQNLIDHINDLSKEQRMDIALEISTEFHRAYRNNETQSGSELVRMASTRGKSVNLHQALVTLGHTFAATAAVQWLAANAKV